MLLDAIRGRPDARSDRGELVAALCDFLDAVLEDREHLLPRVSLVLGNATLLARALIVKEQWAREVARLLAGTESPDANHRVLGSAIVSALQHSIITLIETGEIAGVDEALDAALDSTHWPTAITLPREAAANPV